MPSSKSLLAQTFSLCILVPYITQTYAQTQAPIHAQAQHLTLLDRFAIYEQMSLHQTLIDTDLTCANAHSYADLYWPEGSFRVIDPNRDSTVIGHLAIRSNFDYAHSVFPLYQWRHSVGAFQISPSPPNTTTNSSSSPSSSSPSSEPPAAAPPPALQASALWKWRVDWKANTTGVVSTGTYEDVFEKRGEEWKVLRRVSRDDPNWPLYVFAPYADNAEGLYRSSCGDT